MYASGASGTSCGSRIKSPAMPMPVNQTKRSSPSKSSNNAYRHEKPEIDITKEEFQRIKDALEKEEFRKLFFDYIEEIQDPENRKIYEKEIKQFEAERGVDVKFVNPEPGFVVKTSENGTLKCFINIAKSDIIEKPKSEVTNDPATGNRGLTWAIPLAQSPPRDDLDAQKKLCRVYDVVFHSDALYLAQKSEQFRKCLIDTALDAVEREFKVKLDRTNLKFPKLQFKGIARPTVIRSLSKHPTKEALEPHPLDDIYPSKPAADKPKPKLIPAKPLTKKPEFNTPKYNIKYRRDIDLTEYVDHFDAKLNMTVPRELVVEIDLPLLKSAADCTLDVTEKKIYFLSDKCGAKYSLSFELPYAVLEKQGTARFDVETRKLCITLPVKQPTADAQRAMRETLMQLNREDSGVESDVREENSSSAGSPIEELSDDHDVLGDLKQSQQLSLSPRVAALPLPFLRSSISYELPPKFDCNLLENLAAFVLHVRNVEPDSLKMIETERSVHLQFYTLGSGYFPQYYAFYMELPEQLTLRILGAELEAWENNVVLTLNLSGSTEHFNTYKAGLDPCHLKEYGIYEKFKIINSSNSNNSHSHSGSSSSMQGGRGSGGKQRSCSPSARVCRLENLASNELTSHESSSSSSLVTTTATEEDEALPPRKGKAKSLGGKSKKNNKRRSYSESTVDDIKAFEGIHIKQRSTVTTTATTTTATPTNNANASSKTSQAMSLLCSSYRATAAMAVPSPAGQQHQQHQQQQQRKQRSYSECRPGGGSGSGGASTLPPSFKGILKHYSRYDKHPSMSGSSSSIDDSSSYSCSIDGGGIHGSGSGSASGSGYGYRFSQSFSDIPEENRTDGLELSLSESCKKTVRFSDVIKKQIFRYDSSILGQKKKNQKRRELKQRALQRRHSEGDSADYDDVKNDVFYNSKFNSPRALMRSSNCNNYSDHENDGFKLSEGNCNSNNNHNNNSKSINCKSPLKGKATKTRARLESESSADMDAPCKTSMIFHMDM